MIFEETPVGTVYPDFFTALQRLYHNLVNFWFFLIKKIGHIP